MRSTASPRDGPARSARLLMRSASQSGYDLPPGRVAGVRRVAVPGVGRERWVRGEPLASEEDLRRRVRDPQVDRPPDRGMAHGIVVAPVGDAAAALGPAPAGPLAGLVGDGGGRAERRPLLLLEDLSARSLALGEGARVVLLQPLRHGPPELAEVGGRGAATISRAACQTSPSALGLSRGGSRRAPASRPSRSGPPSPRARRRARPRPRGDGPRPRPSGCRARRGASSRRGRRTRARGGGAMCPAPCPASARRGATGRGAGGPRTGRPWRPRPPRGRRAASSAPPSRPPGSCRPCARPGPHLLPRRELPVALAEPVVGHEGLALRPRAVAVLLVRPPQRDADPGELAVHAVPVGVAADGPLVSPLGEQRRVGLRVRRPLDALPGDAPLVGGVERVDHARLGDGPRPRHHGRRRPRCPEPQHPPRGYPSRHARCLLVSLERMAPRA